MRVTRLTKAAIIGVTAAGAAYMLAQKKKNAALSEATKTAEIDGCVNPGYEAVREAFVENFTRRREVGAACCVYHKGEKVVDLWGGVRNQATGEPWGRDTKALVYSATKGLSAMTLAVAHSWGWLSYDERVCKYWPEFAQNGKEGITVRQLLAHQAGLFALDVPLDRSLVADLDRLAVVLACQKPAWVPGTHQAYHAITLGFYEGELLRRIDPKHRSLGQFFQEEIATPLRLAFYIRLPESIPDSELAPLVDPSRSAMLFGFPLRLTLDILNPRSNFRRALLGSELAHDDQHIYARNLEIPAGGGVGTARAIAHAYSVFASGGKELGLRPETLQELTAAAVPAAHGFYDECIKDEVEFSLGFMKPNRGFPFGSPSSFGHPGAGGSFGFADPEVQIGYAYMPNLKGVTMGGDPRDVALRRALFTATPAART
jgi:CubicO group peptidase (beta-lactamase class C family)